MAAICKKPLNRKLAIFLAILVMWLVGGIGLALMHTGDWNLILLSGYNVGTLGQIGGYYLARVGAQIPALGFAACIISLSDFRRPWRTAWLTGLAYHGIMVAIRVARNPWSIAPDLDQSIPILAEVAHLTVMVAFLGLFSRFFIWLVTWLDTGPLARYFAR